MTSAVKPKLYWTCMPKLDRKKESIIFLHASWMSSEMFDDTINHLSKSFPNVNLVCVDLMAHGKSTQSLKGFTLWDQGDEVVSLMDELKIQKATLVGVSMGAGIAMRIALRHPFRVTGLVLMGSTAEAATPEGIASISQVRDIWVSTPTPSEDIMDIAIRAWGGDPDVNSSRSRRVKQDWVKRHSGAENVDPVLQSLNERDLLLPMLHEISVPVLLIHGEKDGTWELAGVFRIRDAIGGDKTRIHIVKGSGHLVIHMRDSEDISDVIAKFIVEKLS